MIVGHGGDAVNATSICRICEGKLVENHRKDKNVFECVSKGHTYRRVSHIGEHPAFHIPQGAAENAK